MTRQGVPFGLVEVPLIDVAPATTGSILSKNSALPETTRAQEKRRNLSIEETRTELISFFFVVFFWICRVLSESEPNPLCR